MYTLVINLTTQYAHTNTESGLPLEPDVSTRTCAMDIPLEDTMSARTIPARTMPFVIAVPVIVAVGALFVIALTVSVIIYYCRRKSTNRPKVCGRATVIIRGDVNLHPSHNSHYDHQVDRPQRDIETVNPLVNYRASCDTGSYVINSLGPSDHDNPFNQRVSSYTGSYVINCLGIDEDDDTCEEQYCHPASCEKDLKQQLRNLEVKEVFIENIE